MSDAIVTSPWRAEDLKAIGAQTGAALAPFTAADVLPVVPGYDLWDMWHIADRDGATVFAEGCSWWFFLASPALPDPEARHDHARIRLLSHGHRGWRDHGWTFAADFAPGTREWSGSAVLGGDGVLTMYFTATGRRDAAPSFEQRLFETRATLRFEAGLPAFGAWSAPIESVVADGRVYARANDAVIPARGITGFRDPGYFRDPADGAEYMLFTANDADAGTWPDGVIGLARRVDGRWTLQPPIVGAPGVNSELERAHVIVHGGRYYLFWSTHRHRFAAGLDAPAGLYAMSADRFDGAWRPVNGSGLVAANPPAAPLQAYCWWVTQELGVASFVNYWRGGPQAEPPTAAARRAAFGGTPAPFFRLKIEGERVTIAR